MLGIRLKMTGRSIVVWPSGGLAAGGGFGNFSYLNGPLHIVYEVS